MERPLQPRGTFDPLDLHFWQTDQGNVVFSPWLWLGRHYKIGDRDDGEKLRQSIQESLAYRLIRNPAPVFIFLLITGILGIFLFDYYSYDFKYLGPCFILFTIIIVIGPRILICIRMSFLASTFPISRYSINHRQFLRRRIELIGIMEYVNYFCFITISTPTCIFLLYILSSYFDLRNSDNMLMLIYIVCSLYLIRIVYIVYSIRVYCISRTPVQELKRFSSQLNVTRTERSEEAD